ncbi:MULTISPECIES: NAD-dependent epimerase [Bradyrhizobium]|jgi:UDP-glucuronate 4-epimerase|uniref:NAD-dependent epimerase n=1 Tax=Bradyrhizobium TaxID=374 RepID=UPI000485B787|nr:MULTISPECIES: NAD-dependent epimerase [Bradyrhizobium]MCS3451009.1 UDP-glucuronate 4-epimerase [Bradyrhizobium elkanii]MCS3557845.1 UDP-glucuronate 4-epimerase [Bradyrhizobium elkanii]MCW2152308.1 UDP-glucuronate 4-epimerase [Bradyrhizobium elkanii]MCW2357816.1 UDP-glucuronate 4-epimerase [Bradyrhizobium elkanii]MCW2376038.1 UDP-glucuronate 4-epimerase [Bradyrhizobium elkanii]
MSSKAVLVTGAAGFIGFHVSQRLLSEGHDVVGVDNINDYYDPSLKRARLDLLKSNSRFSFEKLDLADRREAKALFDRCRFAKVIHLAAQAGVRYSIQDPHAYVDANMQGFLNILEGCRHNGCQHLVYASSSSVYGANSKLPFSTEDGVDHPISLYAASKRANELMAHSYSHLYRLPTTGLRFFTVYGPWGRPDMAMFIFARSILAGEPIRLFNHGRMRRDFTYVDDVSQGVVRLIDRAPQGLQDWNSDKPDRATSSAPWKIYNIGNNKPEELTYVISLLEKELGKVAVREMLPMQPGDVEATYADVKDLERDIGFRPATPIEEGVARFVKWYRDYYRI